MKVLLLPRWREGCLLHRKVEFQLSEGEERVLKPCAGSELMAEMDLGGALDFPTLCSLLKRARLYELRCSPSLRVARFKWGIAEVSIFGDGKIKLRHVLDRQELSYFSSRLARLLWGAMLCGVCGRPALHCASGRCQCAEGTRAVAVDDPLLLKALSALEKTEELEAGRSALLFTMEARGEEAPLGLFLLSRIEGL